MKQCGGKLSFSRSLPRATLVLAVAGLLPACSRGHDDQQKGGSRKLRVVLQPFLSFAPLMIADAEGYFAEQGLAVEFVRMNRLTDAVPMLLTGGIDVLPGTALPGTLNSMARGEAIRMVADKGYFDPQGCTHMAIMAQPGPIPTRAGSRATRRLSTEREAPSLYIVQKALEREGLSLDSFQILQIPNAPEMEALASGSIDAAFAGEPWLSRIVRNGKGVVWIPAEQALPDFQFSFIFFGPNLLQHDRDAGRRFMVAYRKGIKRYREGKTPRNLDILAKAMGEDPDLLKSSCWPTVRENSRINLGSLLDFQRWSKAQGFVPQAATPAQLWDSSFVAHADSVLKHRSN